MNGVLIDKHHAGLFHSLQLLGDRLGWMVYTPVGHAWWDAGYWRFGEGYGDDRLARQFLTLEGWTPTPDSLAQGEGYRIYTRTDPHYPEREVLGIELGRVLATTQEWRHIIATVQDNQHGFARLAEELRTRNASLIGNDGRHPTYVLQVGNVNQDVDWRLDPLALVSTDAPISNSRGVIYHQEFDSDGIFRFREPYGARRVASFVNCFDSTPCYALAKEADRSLAMRFFGIDGRDGNIDDIREQAFNMEVADWGWHDKVQGDGFGHVIHGWAAIGRPLIGHASHYRGLMAEPFWEDGVTCIDLDRHSVEEVVERVLTISPGDHLAMCHAIRERFDELVDYDAEAESIRALLA